MTDETGADAEDDPLIGALMRLAQADFSARAPRTYSGDRRDTIAYLVNTVSEELARVVSDAKRKEESLESAVQTFTEVLSAHAAGDFSARAPREEDGSLLDVLAFIINNTGAETGRLFEERNKAYDALKEAKETEAISKARSAFLANVSHELRTPLTLVLGPLHNVLTREQPPLPDQAREELRVVLRNASRLSRMVNDLLDFTKAEEGKLVVRWQQVDLAAMARDAVSDLQPIARERGIELSGDVPADFPTAIVDRRMIEKIVINLVSNALKFTEEGGNVRVQLRSSADSLTLQVRDSGIGIGTDNLDKVFERFHQVDSSQSRRFEGTGLGLALVREFARAMNGDATVESELGVGSQFSIVLPRHPPGAEVLPPDAQRHAEQRFADVAELSESSPGLAPAEHPTGGLPHVLFAEDNPDMRRYVLEVLQREFDVNAVADGQLALEALEQRVPDVILSDVMMPRIDGFELVRRAKADPRTASVPIVLLTARAGTDAVADGLDVGADDYLAKPFQPRELAARVRAAARLRQTTKQLAITLDELQVTKTLVLRLGQVTCATGMLARAGEQIDAAVKAGEPAALADVAARLVGLRSLMEVDDDAAPCDLLEIVGEVVGSSAANAGPFPTTGDAPTVARAVDLLLQAVRIPRDGTATVGQGETSHGQPFIAIEAPAPEGSVRDLSAPLKADATFDELEQACAQLALHQRGIEAQAESTDGRLRLRLLSVF